MNSAIASVIALVIVIIMIIKKISPVYSLMAGALLGGLLSGWGMTGTVEAMISGIKDISPAILRILAAGVLSGVLIKTGAADSISSSIVRKLGKKQVYTALAISTMILCGAGVFVDVAVITVAPIAISLQKDLKLPLPKVLLAMIAGGKCGNVISPNPNTIVAAENYAASLPAVMAANIIPAVITLLVIVYLVIPFIPERQTATSYADQTSSPGEKLPSFLASITGPLTAVILLSLRPLFGIAIDPAVALPLGGFAGILATRKWRETASCLSYGLEKMSGVAILLVATGTIAGIIKASSIKDILIAALSSGAMSSLDGNTAGYLLAMVSSILMTAATASTTAGATISSASFSPAVLATGASPLWSAALTNASATVIDHLPHGSFFHATAGSVGLDIKERLRLIPYESLTGLLLTGLSFLSATIMG